MHEPASITDVIYLKHLQMQTRPTPERVQPRSTRTTRTQQHDTCHPFCPCMGPRRPRSPRL